MGDAPELRAIADRLPDRKERRRYALLQAAATIYHCPRCASGDLKDGRYHAWCALEAEKLLAEVEKREKAEGES